MFRLEGSGLYGALVVDWRVLERSTMRFVRWTGGLGLIIVQPGSSGAVQFAGRESRWEKWRATFLLREIR